jgi:hypothetical protein
MSAIGTKPCYEASIGRSAVDAKAAVRRTHRPLVLMTRIRHGQAIETAKPTLDFKWNILVVSRISITPVRLGEDHNPRTLI